MLLLNREVPHPASLHNLQMSHGLPAPWIHQAHPFPKTKGARPRRWWAWPGLRRQPILTASRWPPSGLLACLPWRADPDVGGFPAAGGQVQDGRSCCDVGVFTALAGAVGAGTAWALCVGACTRQPGGKFPWTGKMLRCWREIWLAIAQTWIYSLNRLVWKTELLAWKYVKNTQKHNPFSLCTLNECYSDWFSLEFIYQTRWLRRRKAYSLNIFCIYTFYEKNCNSGYWARALAAQVVKMVDSSLR